MVIQKQNSTKNTGKYRFVVFREKKLRKSNFERKSTDVLKLAKNLTLQYFGKIREQNDQWSYNVVVFILRNNKIYKEKTKQKTKRKLDSQVCKKALENNPAESLLVYIGLSGFHIFCL